MKHLCILFSILFSFELLSAQDNKTYDYTLENVLTISIPKSMVLQGGKYKELKSYLIEHGYVNISRDQMSNGTIIFQQNGLNELEKAAYLTYARIIINYTYDDSLKSVGPIFTDKDISVDDINEYDQIVKKTVINEMSGLNGKIVKWYGTKIISKKYFSALQTRYERQLASNKPVYVERDFIINKGYSVLLVISARIDEKETKYNDLWKIIDSIKLITAF